MNSSSTELFRRAVVLPIGSTALEEFRRDQIDDLSAFKVVAFDGDDQFYRIWSIGIFEAINLQCRVIIDDFESEEVGEGFETIATLLDAAARHESLCENDGELLLRMRDLAISAKVSGMSLFFVF